MVVEIPAEDRAPATQVGFPKFEDRIILVRAADEEEARVKGKKFAADYGTVTSWKVREIVDVHEILDPELGDGIEIYSAFIDREWADALTKNGTSPVAEWKKQNPGKNLDEATVQEVIEAGDDRGKET
jgi:hypothetical protein